VKALLVGISRLGFWWFGIASFAWKDSRVIIPIPVGFGL